MKTVCLIRPLPTCPLPRVAAAAAASGAAAAAAAAGARCRVFRLSSSLTNIQVTNFSRNAPAAAATRPLHTGRILHPLLRFEHV